MIRPFPRYHELYRKRGLGVDSADKARKRFNKKDIIDLQCWSNLVWIHPLAFELDSDLAEFRNKGRGWTEKEKLWLMDKQMELLRQVVPLHRELAERGQVELTTTPFYHPILPLLCDKRLARRAMPNVMLPSHLDGYPEDAREHIRRAVEFHEKLFGQKPRGMWPSEGSVCQGVDSGHRRGRHPMDRHRRGNPLLLDRRLGRPRRQRIPPQSRDALSPLAGRGTRPLGAVGLPRSRHERSDRLPLSALPAGTRGERFHRQARSDRQRHRRQRRPSAHAGEHHPRRRELLGILSERRRRFPPRRLSPRGEHPRIKPVRIADYLARWPATDKIGHLFPGSWIQHNFGIWIGHPECNRAWDLLYETRQWLVAVAGAEIEAGRETSPGHGKSCLSPKGATGSGGSATATRSARTACSTGSSANTCKMSTRCWASSRRRELARPIRQGVRHAHGYTAPTGLLKVKVDGRRSYFKWINAGSLRLRRLARRR